MKDIFNFFKKDFYNVKIPNSKIRKDKFDNIINFANQVINEFNINQPYKKSDTELLEHPLLDVIRLLARKLQTEYLCYLVSVDPEVSDQEYRKEDIKIDNTIFDHLKKIEGSYNLASFIYEVPNDQLIELKKDVILPWPWNRKRLIDNIATIGKGRSCGEWKQDETNHFVILWLPIRIAWVDQGNHSITAGIIQGEGVLKPTKTYDISKVYDIIYCDGEYFRLKKDDSIFCEIKNIEFAAIFEIGRIMIERKISF